jgi:CubicO group peptidase (beta-lactamase class C family)
MNPVAKTAALMTLAAVGWGCTVTDTRATGDDQAPDRGWAYVPGSGDAWETRQPEVVGMDPDRLQEAIDFANAHETSMPRDPGLYLRERFEGQPHQAIVGPTRERGGVNGIVLKDGYIVAEWGDTRRPDMTFSVTKSYLSTVAGLAHDRGLVPDLDGRVVDFVPDATFTSAQNRDITWRHLLTQTSEWEGTLWGKPDAADRRRGVDRTLNPPGTFWEYNDVRVNLLAYALLHVWRRPLPRVPKDEVMDPIGASTTRRWHGYETSWTVVDGLRVQSVSGGGHWGGGFIISTRDHARFGLLLLRRGAWGDRRILSEAWVDHATSPSTVQPNYGFMWWLNGAECGMSTAVGCTAGAPRIFPAAPAGSFFALGAGSTNVIFVDPEHDIVTVTRWIDGGEYVNGFLERVLAAVIG